MPMDSCQGDLSRNLVAETRRTQTRSCIIIVDVVVIGYRLVLVAIISQHFENVSLKKTRDVHSATFSANIIVELSRACGNNKRSRPRE